MTATPKALSRSVLGTSTATLYTTPTATTTIITNIVFANPTGSAASVTINLDGVALIAGVSIAANTTTSYDLRQVLAAAKTITGQAGSAAAISCHISGAETA